MIKNVFNRNGIKRLFPIESDIHHELNKLLNENMDLFADTHVNWIIDRVKEDKTGDIARELLNHVYEVISSIEVLVG